MENPPNDQAMAPPQPAPDMEEIRDRIRAALDASRDKSRIELAKLLNISPAQVTSLLKPGGRRLQAAEVPLVEGYLGISLLESGQGVAKPKLEKADFVLAAASGRPRNRLPPSELESEGTPVAVSDAPPDVARYLESAVADRAAEVWRLSTDRIREAGYLPGDYVVVDREQAPSPGDVVLVEVRQSAGKWVAIFRAYLPPQLEVANSKYVSVPPVLIDDRGVAIIGTIVASVRTRQE